MKTYKIVAVSLLFSIVAFLVIALSSCQKENNDSLDVVSSPYTFDLGSDWLNLPQPSNNPYSQMLDLIDTAGNNLQLEISAATQSQLDDFIAAGVHFTTFEKAEIGEADDSDHESPEAPSEAEVPVAVEQIGVRILSQKFAPGIAGFRLMLGNSGGVQERAVNCNSNWQQIIYYVPVPGLKKVKVSCYCTVQFTTIRKTSPGGPWQPYHTHSMTCTYVICSSCSSGHSVFVNSLTRRSTDPVTITYYIIC